MTTVQVRPRVTSIVQTLGERIKDLRTEAGYTLTELSALSGVTRSTIGHLEKGRVKMADPPTMQALAAALGTEVWDLLIAAGYLEPGPVLEGVEPELIAAAKGRTKDSQRRAAGVLRAMP